MSTTTTAAFTRTHNLGPLTTTFTAPARCARVMLDLAAAPGDGRQAQTCHDGRLTDDAACWPSPTKGVSTASATRGSGGVYTPGFVCPESYATACSATADVKGGFDFQFGLEADETAVGCCPRGFGCHRSTQSGLFVDTVVQTCTSSVTKNSFVAATCSGNNSIMNTYTLPSAKTSASSAEFLIQAPLIQMAWRSSDLLHSTSHSSSAGAATSASASASSQMPSSASAMATASASASASAFSADNTPSGLSIAAAVGVGVGIALLVLAITAMSLFLSARRRRRRDEDLSKVPDAPDPRLEFKAFKYGPSVEVPGSYETSCEIDSREAPIEQGQVQGEQHHDPEPEPEPEPQSISMGRRSTMDRLWDHLYEEVGGRHADS